MKYEREYRTNKMRPGSPMKAAKIGLLVVLQSQFVLPIKSF